MRKTDSGNVLSAIGFQDIMSFGIRPFWQKVYSKNVYSGKRIPGYDRKPLATPNFAIFTN